MSFNYYKDAALSGLVLNSLSLAILASMTSVLTPCLAQNTVTVDAIITTAAAPKSKISAPPTKFTALTPSYPVPAGAIYASPTGSDTGLGTISSPLSLAAAASKVQNGSTLVLRGGIYRGVTELGLSYQNLTIQNAPGEAVWLTGDVDVNTGWGVEKVGKRSIWRKDDWNYSFPSTTSSSYLDPAYPAAGLNDIITQDGVPLVQVTTKEAVVSGTFFVDSVNKRLYVGKKPTGKGLAATMSKRAISVWDGLGPTGYPYTGKGTKIRGLNFRGFATEAILIGAPDVTIENCQSVWNGMQGLSVAYNNRVNTGVTVRGCRFSSNGLKGMAVYRVNDVTVEDCTFDHNNVERFSKEFDAAAIKFVACRGVTFRGNLVTENYANGAWFDVSCFGTQAYFNIVKSNTKGLFLEISHGGWLAFNLLQSNDIGISVAGTSDARVYNNTLVSNRVNLELMDDGRINDTTLDTPLNQNSQPDGNPLEPGENDEEAAMGATWLCRSNVFRNNLMWETTGDAHFKADWTARGEATSLMLAASGNNAYGSQKATPPILKWNVGQGGFRSFATLEGFKATIPGFEVNSIFRKGSGSTNPYFVDLAKGDFRLNDESSAVDAGASLPEDIAEVLGVPTSPQHIGAMVAYIRPRVPQMTQWVPQADTYVRDGADANKNFGKQKEFSIKRSDTQGDNNLALLRFRTGAINGKVTSIKLRLYGSLPTGTEALINAYKVSNDKWTEAGVKWTNAPVVGDYITQTLVSGTTAKYYEWDVTAAALEAVNSDKLLSLALQCEAPGLELAAFNSKENTSKATRPVLVVTTQVLVKGLKPPVVPPEDSWNGS